MLFGLAFLHFRGLVHGFLSLDTVSVGTNGVGRLIGRYTQYVLDHKLLLVQSICYMGPHVAAGHPPTPACDMFCYGLPCLECLSRGLAWAWAAVGEVETTQGTEAELLALMAEGGQAFRAAVVEGRVVPRTAVLDSLAVTQRYDEVVRGMMRKLLSFNPSERPTAQEVIEVNRELLFGRQGSGSTDDVRSAFNGG